MKSTIVSSIASKTWKEPPFPWSGGIPWTFCPQRTSCERQPNRSLLFITSTRPALTVEYVAMAILWIHSRVSVRRLHHKKSARWHSRTVVRSSPLFNTAKRHRAGGRMLREIPMHRLSARTTLIPIACFIMGGLWRHASQSPEARREVEPLRPWPPTK